MEKEQSEIPLVHCVYCSTFRSGRSAENTKMNALLASGERVRLLRQDPDTDVDVEGRLVETLKLGSLNKMIDTFQTACPNRAYIFVNEMVSMSITISLEL